MRGYFRLEFFVEYRLPTFLREKQAEFEHFINMQATFCAFDGASVYGYTRATEVVVDGETTLRSAMAFKKEGKETYSERRSLVLYVIHFQHLHLSRAEIHLKRTVENFIDMRASFGGTIININFEREEGPEDIDKEFRRDLDKELLEESEEDF